MYLQLTPFIALAAAFPYPFPSSTHHNTILPRAAKSKCSTPGAFLCKGSTMQGMCDGGTIIYMPVAAGTICTCSSGECSIVASDSSMPSASASATAPIAPSASAPTGGSPTGSRPSGHSGHPKGSKQPGNSIVPVPSSTAHSKQAPSASSAPAAPTGSAPPSGSAKPKHSAPSASASSPAAPSASPSSPSGSGTYKFYQGDGSVADGWPAQSDWLSFDALWAGYEKLIGANCETAFQVPNNTPEETADIKKSLLSVSQAAGIPAEFSLAIMMQESLGCAHVPTTNGGVVNPGLFQDHDGKGTCANTPTCPSSEIEQMCKDGIQGTTAGPGLQQLVKQAGSSGAQTFYRAARLYNSGSIAPDGNLGEGVATHCYCSDVANRLTGQWFSGLSTCTLD